MNDYEILIADHPDYEYEMAEIWYKGQLIVMITQETEMPKVEIYTSGQNPLVVDYRDFIKALTTAHNKLDQTIPLGCFVAEYGFFKNKNVRNVGPDFDSFFKNFQRPGYWLAYNVVAFHSFAKTELALADLDKLLLPKVDKAFIEKTSGIRINYTSGKLEGLLAIISFASAKEKLVGCLEHMKIQGQQKEHINEDMEIFWSIVNKHLTLPPTRCYEHIPTKGSYFDWGDIGRFCFVLLNSDGKGIIVHIGVRIK